MHLQATHDLRSSNLGETLEQRLIQQYFVILVVEDERELTMIFQH